MTSPRLLLVEDDPALAELLEFRFQPEGYSVTSVANGDHALTIANEQPPDLVILDWMLEGTNGLDVCRLLRASEATAQVPIIMLTARGSEEDRIRGLECGADDYVSKPFSPRELIARAKAVMRRVRPALASEILVVGELSLDVTEHRLSRRGQPLTLGPTEYRLIKFLMENPRRVFSRVQLLDNVWGQGNDIDVRTVDVHVRRLRKALEFPGSRDPIRTVRGSGYSLDIA